MYCPSVRQSTPASRSSAANSNNIAIRILLHSATPGFKCVKCDLGVPTCQGVEYLLVRLAQSQHDGGLCEYIGFDLFGVLQDIQRLVKVRSGVTYVPANRWDRKTF